MVSMMVLEQVDKEPEQLLEDLIEKLDEETSEVKQSVIDEDVIAETLDVIQVCIGILDLYKDNGKDLKWHIQEHNKKLLGRGWTVKELLNIEGVGNGQAGI
jgi:predicted house-cleaning noncanonical NTP pyrophosphatase (MazG superfamily)